MEAKNVERNNSSRGNKKTQIRIGLFASGVFIIAGLFATFVVKRNKRRASDGNPNTHIKGSPKFNTKDYESRGLGRLLQNPPIRCDYSDHGASSVVSDITNEDRGTTEIHDNIEIHEEDYREKDITVYHDLRGFQEENCIIIEAEAPIESDEEVGIELQLIEEEKGKEDEKHIAKNGNEFSKDTGNSSLNLNYNKIPKLETYRLEKSGVEINASSTVEAEIQTYINSHNSVFNHKTERGTTATEHLEHSSSNIYVWILPMLMVAVVMFLMSQILFMVKLC